MVPGPPIRGYVIDAKSMPKDWSGRKEPKNTFHSCLILCRRALRHIPFQGKTIGVIYDRRAAVLSQFIPNFDRQKIDSFQVCRLLISTMLEPCHALSLLLCRMCRKWASAGEAFHRLERSLGTCQSLDHGRHNAMPCKQGELESKRTLIKHQQIRIGFHA